MNTQILLVDDDPLYIDLVRDVLATKQHSVITASNGSAALALLKDHRVAMIISDVDMPGMDGLTFHTRVQREEHLRATPFVFLTGATDARVASYAREMHIPLLSKSNLFADLLALMG